MVKKSYQITPTLKPRPDEVQALELGKLQHITAEDILKEYMISALDYPATRQPPITIKYPPTMWRPSPEKPLFQQRKKKRRAKRL